MKSKKIISPLVVIALAMLLAVSPILATAQRHRRRTRHAAPSSGRASAPAHNTPVTSSAAPVNTPATTTTHAAGADATATSATTATTQGERAEADRSVESLLSADAYALHVEVRKIGQLVRSGEVKTALAALRLTGETPKEFNELFAFLSANAEDLDEARIVVSTIAARKNLPQTLVALELSSAERAAKFEPNLRAFISQTLGMTLETKNVTSVSGASSTRKGQSARAGNSAGQVAGRHDNPPLAFRRAGRWLFAADKPFTFKQLKGDGTINLLAENARFQSVSSRFASEPVFVYYDFKLSEQAMRLRYVEAEAVESVSRDNQPENDETVVDPVVSPSQISTLPQASAMPSTPTEETTDPKSNPMEAQATPSPEETPEVEIIAPVNIEPKKDEVNVASAQTTTPPDAVDPTAVLMRMMGGALWDGDFQTPEAVGVGVALEGDAVAVRALVVNREGVPLSVVPFIPNLVAGPAIVPDAATVAPADTDIFISATLDWTRIYETMLTKMRAAQSHKTTIVIDGQEPETTPDSSVKQQAEMPDAEKQIEAVEKLLGFKIREDLLPSLGNEVAFGVPLQTFNGGSRFNRANDAKDGATKAGPVVIIALNNPEKMRAILPKALALAGLGASGAQPQIEKHDGFEIQSFGEGSFAFINNFLVAGENAASVRHVIDAYNSQQTLVSRPSYRDASAWQPRQKLAQVFVSEALMKTTLDDLHKRSEDITDPVLLAIISKLNVEPQAATYAVLGEGESAVFHELRVPISLIETYAAGIYVGMKDAPAQSGEIMTLYAMTRLRTAEETFKTTKGEGKFGTLEELQAAKLIEKDFMSQQQYKFVLNASGDKYEMTATPKEYGKTGRRSFFIDETGIIRAANHKGQPAGINDPPVD